MAGKKWSEEEDKFLRENHETMSAMDIAKALGRAKHAVDHRRSSLRLPALSPEFIGARNTSVWLKELESRIGEPVALYLSRRYVDEHASYRQLVKEMGINTRSLMKLIRDSGIEPRTPAQSLSLQLQKDPDFLTPFIRAGQREETRLKTAIIRQNTLSHMSESEYRFLEVLRAHGLSPVPQMAVETYNIDFAFPEIKLAVEWHARWHRTKKKRPIDHKRTNRLMHLGWEVLLLDTRASDEHNVRKVSEAFKCRASTHPR